MKWQAVLVPLLVLTSTASAQEIPSTAEGPATSFPLAESTRAQTISADPRPTVFLDAPGAQSQNGFLTGNHNFPNFIGFMSDPLQSIDPRAMTDLYPIFGSSWVSSFHPLPSGDFQLYGAGLTLAL